jgi:hypothetical protein
MSRRRELPEPFDAPFRVGDALDAGIPRSRLRASDLRSPHHGVRSSRADAFVDRCAALAAVMSPSQAFTGPTAALLYGAPLPARWERDRRLHVSSLRPQRAMRRPGVVGGERGQGDVQLVAGLPVLAAEEVWLSLGRALGLADLVAVGDFLVMGQPRSNPISTIEALDHACRSASGRPGAARVRAALPRVRRGAWSRPETFLRLLIDDAGLPEPTLNQPVLLPDGRWAAPDLAWHEFRIAIEYDGAAFHGADQWDADADRHERLADAGWLVVRIRRDELFHRPGEVVARLVRRLDERGYRHPVAIDLTRMARFVA